MKPLVYVRWLKIRTRTMIQRVELKNGTYTNYWGRQRSNLEIFFPNAQLKRG